MREETVRFINARGEGLAGVVHHPRADSRRAVILCHGMESDKNSAKLVYLAGALAERGVLALRFDFAACGDSDGSFDDITYTGEVADLRAAFDFISQQYRSRIAIFGSSMGGTVGLLFAADEPAVTSLVTVAAPLHPENFPRRMLTEEGLRQWRELGFTTYNGRRLNISLFDDLEGIDVPAAARRIRCPVLIFHGDQDEVVPVEEARELESCLTNPKLSILPGVDHRFSNPEAMEKAMSETLHWLTSTSSNQ